MSWLKYVLKTDWKQKQADWAEYQTLRQNAVDAHNAMLAARGGISTVCNAGQHFKPRACINYIKHEKNRMEVKECPNLYYDGCIRYCYEYACEWAEKKDKYHQAVVNANQVRQALEMFWTNKFAQVK